MAKLEYYIVERVLRGTVGAHTIQYFALSGGAGGRLTNPFPTDVVNNPYFEGQKTLYKGDDPRHVHGGPLPPGWYTVFPPRASTKKQRHDLGRCAQLEPLNGKIMMGRDQMFIHGRGSHGSDGCIVPMLEKPEFYQFMDWLDEDGGGNLFVDESVEGYRFA